MSEAYWTLTQAAAFLKVTENTVRNLIRREDLTSWDPDEKRLSVAEVVAYKGDGAPTENELESSLQRATIEELRRDQADARKHNAAVIQLMLDQQKQINAAHESQVAGLLKRLEQSDTQALKAMGMQAELIEGIGELTSLFAEMQVEQKKADAEIAQKAEMVSVVKQAVPHVLQAFQQNSVSTAILGYVEKLSDSELEQLSVVVGADERGEGVAKMLRGIIEARKAQKQAAE